MSIKFDLKILLAALAISAQPVQSLAALRCEEVLGANVGKLKAGVATRPVSLKPPQVAWPEAIEALKQINQTFYNREQVIETLATAALANEFVWINGEPGGAKTALSRLMFQSIINSIPESDKKIFVLQFHKLISEGKISGFQKFSSMMKDGKYEIETSSSLVGDKFLFLIADEAEKSNPAVLNALLSVLNERKAFLGSKVVDAILSSGVFTSNKTTGEFIQGFLTDRPSGEALLDRMAIKIHIPNQQLSARERIAMYDMVKNPNKVKIELPLLDLQALVNKVVISDEVLSDIGQIIFAFDGLVVDKSDDSRKKVRYGETESEYFPANQFSNRSDRRLIQVFKASLIADQLMRGVPYDKIRLNAGRQDMHLLAKSALTVGPSVVRLQTFKVTEIKNGKIESNGVRIESDLGIKSDLQAEYSPYNGRLFLQDLQGNTQIVMALKDKKWVVESKTADFEDYSVDEASLDALGNRLNQILTDNKVNLAVPKFEVDASGIDKLIAKGTVKERTRLELLSIKEDLQKYADVLNQQMDKPVINLVESQKLLPPRSTKEIRAFRREVRNLTGDERTARYYDWMVYEVQALSQRFVELQHSIEAHLTGILSENHLYVFGPPGGAKTALAEVMLKSELRKLNADQLDGFVKEIITNKSTDQKFLHAALERMQSERPKVFQRFLLQFHKLLPEGVLIGFPKVEKQLNEGVEEIETSTSLASEKFIFAILDEVDKANPQTITALLSILNEREVFAGNTVIKTALRTAILTSNKMPSEFLDSYREDRSTGEAVMDRAPDKVYVSNKFSSVKVLVQFLSNLEKGISPNWKGLLAVSELKPLVEKVEFENPAVREAIAKIHDTFLAERIKEEEKTRKAHMMDPREFPEYYVAASGSASDRTFIKLLDQFKAHFIVHQLMEGVPYKEIRTVVEMKDLNLYFEGLGYWAPQKIISTFNADGTIEFKQDSHIIEGLLNSGVSNSRVKYHLEKMMDEARDFTRVANAVVQEFMAEYKAEIVKYPELFPTMLGTQMTLQEAAEISLENLAKLKLELEAAKSQNGRGADVQQLTQEYNRKEKELVDYLEEKNLMTRDEVKAKLRPIIQRLQNP